MEKSNYAGCYKMVLPFLSVTRKVGKIHKNQPRDIMCQALEKKRLNKFQSIKITQNTIFNHNGIQLEINLKKKEVRCPEVFGNQALYF